MKKCVLLLFLGLAITGVTAPAHHSISGTYSISKTVALEGVIREFHFVNPHPFLLVEVLDANGTAQIWRLEMDSISDLSEAGMKKTTFKAGDRVIASGNPAIAEKQSIFLRKLERPSDGLQYEQRGASPRIFSKAQ